jgi:uncharacterized membrane protein
MISVEMVYRLAGLVVGAAAIATLFDRKHATRYATAFFWGTYAITLFFGAWLSHFAAGCLVIALALVGGIARLGRGAYATTTAEERSASAERLRNRLFYPALVVPVGTLVLGRGARSLRIAGAELFDPKNASVVALAVAALAGLVYALAMTRQPPKAGVQEARRLLDLVGWAAVLPQMLAALGALFGSAGTGDRVAELFGHVLPAGSLLAVVCAYSVGMALFTVILGNAFAAFPIMAAAIGVPLLVRRFGADPAAMAAIGMLSGFCGTLMTPMAANFNIVPAALLELPDKNAVIRAQIPTALLLLSANTLLMYVFAGPHR